MLTFRGLFVQFSLLFGVTLIVQETLGNRGNTSRFLYGLSKHEQLPYVLSSADDIPEKLRDWSNLYLSATSNHPHWIQHPEKPLH
jgi:hypothetical protein